jgi:hypothetical protein
MATGHSPAKSRVLGQAQITWERIVFCNDFRNISQPLSTYLSYGLACIREVLGSKHDRGTVYSDGSFCGVFMGKSAILFFKDTVWCAVRKKFLMKSSVLRNITSCISVKVNRRFGGTYRRHLHG